MIGSGLRVGSLGTLALLVACATPGDIRDGTERITKQQLEDQAKDLELHKATQTKVDVVQEGVKHLLTPEQRAQVDEAVRKLVQERVSELQKEMKDLEQQHNALNQDYSEKVRARWSGLITVVEAVGPLVGQFAGGLLNEERVNALISSFLGDPQKAAQVTSAINLEGKLAGYLPKTDAPARIADEITQFLASERGAQAVQTSGKRGGLVPTELLQVARTEMESRVAQLGLSPDQVSALKGKPNLMEMLLAALGAAGAGGVLAKTGKSRAQKDIDELWELMLGLGRGEPDSGAKLKKPPKPQAGQT